MGKWSQYRRRGKPQNQSAAGPGAPPAPTLSVSDGHVLQTANGGTDTGATCTLYTSTDGGITFLFFDSEDWAHLYDWGPASNFTGIFVYATETGNGTTYIGESTPSNVLSL